MSVGPAPAWPDQPKATRLPSGDNAGGPSTPGYEAKGNSWAGALTGERSARQVSATAIAAATAATAPTVIHWRLRFGTHVVCCGSGRTTGGAEWADEEEFASKTGT